MFPSKAGNCTHVQLTRRPPKTTINLTFNTMSRWQAYRLAINNQSLVGNAHVAVSEIYRANEFDRGRFIKFLQENKYSNANFDAELRFSRTEFACCTILQKIRVLSTHMLISRTFLQRMHIRRSSCWQKSDRSMGVLICQCWVFFCFRLHKSRLGLNCCATAESGRYCGNNEVIYQGSVAWKSTDCLAWITTQTVQVGGNVWELTQHTQKMWLGLTTAFSNW